MDTMPSTPKQLLEQAAKTRTLLPGLSEADLANFQQNFPRPLPPEIRELLLYTAGFDATPFGLCHADLMRVRFVGHDSWAFPQAFPQSVDLLPDGSGNFWIIDVNPDTGAWGAVFYACHDPAVVIVQAPDLATFLTQIISPKNSAPPNALRFVHGNAATRIWADDPYVAPAPVARLSTDSVVSNFASTVADSLNIADLRSLKVGIGFSVGNAGPTANIRRSPDALIFAIEPNKLSFFSRLFRRR
jgi:cell wall assembly regulator SMI1